MEIRIKKVGKKIKGITVLRNISLDMQSGLVYGIYGENGSGKTMLMRLIAGLIKPTTGVVYIDRKKLGKDIDFPEKTGMLLENPAFLEQYTGKKNLEILAGLSGIINDEQIKLSLLRVGLIPNDKRKYRKYSLGMKQKLGIAAAVMEMPDLLILDEPFNALDQQSVLRVKQIICEERDRGALILLACHDRQVLEELADHILVLENGQIKGVDL